MDTGAAETSGGARASQRVATIAVEGHPLASFNLSEIDVAQIVVGQKATVTLDSLADKTFTGEVVSVDRVGKVTNNVAQYPVVVRFDTASPQILPNMAATANIVINTKDNALLIPSSAITNQNGQNLVRILKGNREVLSPVEVGLVSDTQTEILSGVSGGDLVITGTASTSSSGESGSSPFGGGGGMMRIVPH